MRTFLWTGYAANRTSFGPTICQPPYLVDRRYRECLLLSLDVCKSEGCAAAAQLVQFGIAFVPKLGRKISARKGWHVAVDDIERMPIVLRKAFEAIRRHVFIDSLQIFRGESPNFSDTLEFVCLCMKSEKACPNSCRTSNAASMSNLLCTSYRSPTANLY